MSAPSKTTLSFLLSGTVNDCASYRSSSRTASPYLPTSMSSASSWRPNVPESQLFDEKTWLQGGILSAVAYGINLTLFILNVSLLRMRAKLEIKHDIRAKRQTICLLIYVCVIFILSTLTMASQAEMTQLGFIDDRDFPGGPAAYEELKFSNPISNLGTYCVALMNWFSDSLLVFLPTAIYLPFND